MGWYTTAELDKFLAATGDYLRERAAENFTLLSAAGGPPGAGPLYGWWAPGDRAEPRGAFLHDASRRLVIAGRAPEPAAALAATLSRAGRAVSVVDAPPAAADAFGAAWSQRSGLAVRVHRSSQLYRLARTVADYAAPAGRARTAGRADRDLLVSWLRAMAAEVGSLASTPETDVDDLLGYGGAMVWETAGVPVAMALATRPVAGVVNISAFYTSPPYRGRGYAIAAMVAVCRAVLADPAREVMVAVDRMRPLRCAARLGFEPAGERSVLSFGVPTGPLPVQRPTGPVPRIR